MQWCSVGDNGRILSTGTCPDNTPAVAFSHMPGVAVLGIPSEVGHNSHYYSDGSFYPLGEKPGENYFFDYASKLWDLNLDGYKITAIKRITAAKEVTLATGIEYSGKTIDLKPASLTVLYATIEVARASGNEFSVDWVTVDNSILALSRADLLSLSFIIQEFTNEQVIKCRTLKDAIIAATTKEEVDSIVW
jgi:hypothetical protein